MSEEKNKNFQQFLSLADASKQTGYHSDYLGFLCRQGKLKGVKIGRNWVTTKDDLEAFLSSYKNGIDEVTDENGKKIIVRSESPALFENHSEKQFFEVTKNQNAFNDSATDLSSLKSEVLTSLNNKIKNLDKEITLVEQKLKTVEQKKDESFSSNQKLDSGLPAVGVDLNKNYTSKNPRNEFIPNISFEGAKKEQVDNFLPAPSFVPSIETFYKSFNRKPKVRIAALAATAFVVFLGLSSSFLFSNLKDTNSTTVVIKKTTPAMVQVVGKDNEKLNITQDKIIYENPIVNNYTTADVKGSVDQLLQYYISRGLFKGEKGDKGEALLGGVKNDLPYTPIYYVQPSGDPAAGTLSAVTYFSAADFSADKATINNLLTVSGNSNFTGSTTISDLTVSNLSLGFSNGSIIFQGSAGLAQDNSNLFYNASTTQLAIGTSTPNSSAILQLDSTSKGFLAPRMSLVERDAIVSPAIGLLVFNTDDNQYNFYNGTSWLAVGTGGGGNGSVATGTLNSFAYYSSPGQISPQNILFISGNKIGIGSTSPTSFLTIQATGSPVSLFQIASTTGSGLLTVSNSGNLGISTTTPNQKLVVAGNSYVTGFLGVGTGAATSAGGEVLRARGDVLVDSPNSVATLILSSATTTSGYGEINFGYQALPGGPMIRGFGSDDYLVLGTSMAERLRINSSGNVGIGTTTPAARLSVTGNTSIDPFNISSTSGASLLRVTQAGNVGIGTTTPAAALNIIGGTQTGLLINGFGAGNFVGIDMNGNGLTGSSDFWLSLSSANFWRADGVLGSTSIRVGDGSVSGPAFQFQNDSNMGIYRLGTDIMSLVTGGADRLVLNASGNVGINTTTPSQILTVAGNMQLTGALFDTSNASGTLGMILQTTGTGTQWVATSTLGIGSSLNGGTNGLVARWTSATGLSTGTLIDNGTVAGVNATSSTVNFLVQGTGVNTAFQVNSSTGASLLTVLPNGNVGIGTTSPTQTLQVSGNILSYGGDTNSRALVGSVISSSLNYPGIWFGSNAITPSVTNYAFLYDNVSGGVKGTILNTPSGQRFSFRVANSNKFVITSNGGFQFGSTYSNGVTADPGANNMIVEGNVGIGTITPITRLSLIGSTTVDPLDISSTSGTSLLRVTEGGSLGISTTTPTQKLVVVGGARITGALFDSSNASGTNGQILQTTGTGTQWVATSTLGIGSSLNGGTNGLVARWTSASGLSTGTILDNGTVAGVNATSSTTNFLVQGTGSNNPFQINSSTGTGLVTVLANGNVGIGTDTPISKLHLFSSSSYDMRLTDGSGNKKVTLGYSGSDNAGFIEGHNGLNVRTVLIRAAINSNVQGWFSSGLFGIGTSSPAAQLHIQSFPINNAITLIVQASSSQTSNLTQWKDGSNTVLSHVDVSGNFGIGTTTTQTRLSVTGSSTVDPFNISSTSGTSLFRVTQAGNVGIGTSTPNANLTVVQNTNSSVLPGLILQNISNGSSAATVLNVSNDNGNGATFFVSSSANNGIGLANQAAFSGTQGVVVFTDSNVASNGTNSFSVRTGGYNAANEKFRITSAGNVGIGSTSPVYTLSVVAASTVASTSPILSVGTSTNGSLLTFNGQGRLGIGNTSPSAAIDINLNNLPGISNGVGLNISRSADLGINVLASGANTRGYINLTGSSSTWWLSSGSSGLQFINNGSINAAVNALMTSTGFGIGTTTVNTRLSLTGSPTVDPFDISSTSGTSLLRVTQTGNVGIGTTAPVQALSVVGNMRVTGALFDTNNASGTAGMILQTTGTGTQWVATSSLGITGGSLSGGTNGFVARWTSASTLGTGALFDNGTVAGVNATSSSINFLVQGTGANNAFQVNSSTGSTMLKLDALGQLTLGSSANTGHKFYNNGSMRIDSTIYFNGDSPSCYGSGLINGAIYCGSYNGGNVSVYNSYSSNFVMNGSGLWLSGYGPDTTKNGIHLRDYGYVGVNTTTAANTFTIQATSSANTLPLFVVASSTGAQLLKVLANGNVGIGTASPRTMLHVGSVANPGSITVAKGYLCVDDNDTCSAANTDGGIYSVTAATTGADVAENYPTYDIGIKPGDVVVADNSSPVHVVKASSTSSRILGVVSTKPGVLLNGYKAETFGAATLTPVALSGRVPVKVSNENGNIKIGDYLVASKKFNGYAMKATYSGDVIGVALENFEDAVPNSSGKVLVFMKIGYQVINNTFVLGENDGQIANATSSNGVLQAESFLINQKGSGNILQLQNNDENRFLVASSGLVSILASTASTTENILTVSNSSSTLFTINSVGNAKFVGHIMVGKDTAGTAVIKAGDNKTTVTFNNPYNSIPKVIITVNGLPDFNYGVVEKTKNSFTIGATKQMTEDVSFDWFAVEQPEETGSVSGINILNSNIIVPDPTPEVLPIPTLEGDVLATSTPEVEPTLNQPSNSSGSGQGPIPEVAPTPEVIPAPEAIINPEAVPAPEL